MAHSLARGICDRCGFEFPLNQLRKEWTGLKVCRDDFDRRHPQEFVRGVPDKQAVPDPRPEPEPIFVDPSILTVNLTFDDFDGQDFAMLFDDVDGTFLAEGDM